MLNHDFFSSQEQCNWNLIQVLLMSFLCIMVFMLFIIVLIANRDKILPMNCRHGIYNNNEKQSTMCINNDFEVSTF